MHKNIIGKDITVAKRISNKQSKSFYIEIIIAIVFLSIVATVVIFVYSRTNHIIYLNELENDATRLSKSYIECLKSGMDSGKAVETVFIGENYHIEDVSSTQNKYECTVSNEDMTCEIVLTYTHSSIGRYTEVNMKFSSYFGEVYEFDGSVYESINEKR